MTGWMQRPFVALGMLALAMSLIPLNDALIKLMSAYMPLAEIAFVRGMLSMAVLAIFTGGVRSMLALPAPVFWSFFGRGMCLVLAMILYFVPLGSLPLPTVITIFFVSPLLITLLSVPFLGERIGIHRILSVFMGLVGVLIIIRPGTAEFQIESFRADQPEIHAGRTNRRRQHPLDSGNPAIKRQLPHDHHAVNAVRGQNAHGDQQPHGNRQIVMRAFLAEVSGGEVDRNPLWRQGQPH